MAHIDYTMLKSSKMIRTHVSASGNSVVEWDRVLLLMCRLEQIRIQWVRQSSRKWLGISLVEFNCPFASDLVSWSDFQNSGIVIPNYFERICLDNQANRNSNLITEILDSLLEIINMFHMIFQHLFGHFKRILISFNSLVTSL